MGREMVYKKCTACGGDGLYYGERCPACGGKGIQIMGTFEGDSPATATFKKCNACGGSGLYYGKRCPACGGKGHTLVDFHIDEY